MKPYGVYIEEWPDVDDILTMGSKGSVGKYPGRSGDYHPISNGSSKAFTRRYWKRTARAEGRRIIEEQLEEIMEDIAQ